MWFFGIFFFGWRKFKQKIHPPPTKKSLKLFKNSRCRGSPEVMLFAESGYHRGASYGKTVSQLVAEKLKWTARQRNSLSKPSEFVWNGPINSKQGLHEVKLCFDAFWRECGGWNFGESNLSKEFINAETWGIRILVMLGGTVLPFPRF